MSVCMSSPNQWRYASFVYQASSPPPLSNINYIFLFGGPGQTVSVVDPRLINAACGMLSPALLLIAPLNRESSRQSAQQIDGCSYRRERRINLTKLLRLRWQSGRQERMNGGVGPVMLGCEAVDWSSSATDKTICLPLCVLIVMKCSQCVKLWYLSTLTNEPCSRQAGRASQSAECMAQQRDFRVFLWVSHRKKILIFLVNMI